MQNKKEHADFQDEYKRSSNFGTTENDENLEIKGNGDLKLEKDDKMKAKEEKETIKKTLKEINTETEEE